MTEFAAIVEDAIVAAVAAVAEVFSLASIVNLVPKIVEPSSLISTVTKAAPVPAVDNVINTAVTSKP